MGFLGLVRRKGLFGITWGGPDANDYVASQAWLRGDLSVEGALEKPYAQHATIATAISILSADSASVAFEAYPAGATTKDDALETHPVLDVLAKPSPRMSGYQLAVGTYVSLKLFGEAFWYYPDLVLGTRGGGLRATSESSGGIVLVDPRAVRYDRRSGTWRLKARGQEITLAEDRLTQFKRFNPYDPVRGLSELDAILVEAQGDYAAADYNRRLLSQEGVPAGFLIPSETRAGTPEARDEFGKRFNEEHSRRALLRAAMLPPGWSWQDVGIKPGEMEYRALREYSREQILGIYGVPPFMAGVLEKANYANAREQKEVYWLGTITRFLTDIQSTLNVDFLPKIGVTDVELWPDWERVKALTENLSEKTDVAGRLFSLGFTKRQINERLELGMDVDDLLDADVGYLPFSLMPVADILDPPAPAANPFAGEADEEEDEGGGEDEDEDEETRLVGPNQSGTKRYRVSMPLADTEEKRRTLQWRNVVSRTRDLELRFNRGIRKHFHNLEREILDNVGGLKGWRAAREAKAAPPDILFDMERAVKELIKITAPTHRASIKRGGESSLFDIGAPIAFDLQNPAVLAKLAELSGKITKIDSTVERLLRDSLGEGVLNGESPTQLAARVRGVMESSLSRSMTIARTEVGFAFNTGRTEGMKQAGVKRHRWISARDQKVRDTHAPKRGDDGKIVEIGEPFPHSKLLYPLDPSGPPGEVINCRCVTVPVLREGE